MTSAYRCKFTVCATSNGHQSYITSLYVQAKNVAPYTHLDLLLCMFCARLADLKFIIIYGYNVQCWESELSAEHIWRK